MRNLKALLCILILFVSVYTGYEFTLPYYRYFSLKAETKAIARLSYNNPERYRTLVYEEARSLDIPIKPSDIFVSVSDRRVRIATAWSEVVDLAGYYRVPLDFEIDVEE
ncbi:MAG TPA: hypothetical protein ENJ04_01175 [Nitrospirae bacterium]|nr:hypothetical protein [Nitrospirota bacterium]